MSTSYNKPYKSATPDTTNPPPVDVSPIATSAPNNIITSSDYEAKAKKEAQENQTNALLKLGIAGGIGYVGSKIINNNEPIRNFVAKLPGANRYSVKDQIARTEAITSGIDIPDLTAMYAKQSFAKSIHSVMSSIEELSPLNILKTLQLTNLIEPYIDISAELNTTPIQITSDSVRNFQELYTSLIEKASNGNRTLTGNDLKRGFFLKDGVLYAVQADGSLDFNDPVLKKARMITSSVKIGDHYSPNRVLEKYADIHNVDLSRETISQGHTVVIGAESSSKLSFDWMRSYFRYSMEIGYKTLDNPLNGFEDLLQATGLGATNFFHSPQFLKVKSKLNIQLGTNGMYDLSTRDSLKLVGKNIAVKSAALYIGYNAVNQLLSSITPASSVWHNGVFSGLTGLYANTRIGVAKLYSDHLQNYKNSQEEAADGSTSLTTLMGFPMVGALAGASFEYYKRMYLSGAESVERASAQAAQKVGYGFLDGALRKVGFKDTTPMKSKAIIGGIIGLALTVPFLPGALIGKSSDQLRDEYSGKTEIANRANKGWLMGGSSFKGDSVKNFQTSRVAMILSNAKNIVRYGDNDTKRRLDPIYSPLGYLENPYRFEEMHKNDMPYPVWGMDVNYGSFLGKIYQGTVGEVIKPTVINKEFIAKAIEARRTLITRSEDSMAKNSLKQQVIPKDEFQTLDAQTSHHRPKNDMEADMQTISFAYKVIKGSIQAPTITTGNSTNDGHIITDGKSAIGDYAVGSTVASSDAAMINSGMMYSLPSPSSNPKELAVRKAFASFTDFTGAKGFATNLTLGALGFNPEATKLQLARSGSATSAAADFADLNIGDAWGLGEFQRRMLPTSSGSRQNYSNPMQNYVAPSWMPHNLAKYYIDFSQGNYYDSVANGEARLAGKGYTAIHKELKGRDPDKYPLVYKYKILSDTASGSAEQIAMRDALLNMSNKHQLNETEQDMFFTTLEQEQIKSRKKTFSEYKTSHERSRMSMYQNILSDIWQPLAHNSESVLEPLTPFRPGAKFIHKRTAIEDYEKTQLDGPDTGIWTNPYAHFIKPALNRIVGLVPGTHVPNEAAETARVNEYFDKLAYLKARMNHNPNDALKTVIGSAYAGVTDLDSMNKFKASLTEQQRAYVDAFASETNQKKREKILAMVPTDAGMVYQSIWRNLGVAEAAKRKGRDIHKSIEKDYIKNTSRYVKVAGGTASRFSSPNMDQTVNQNNHENISRGKVKNQQVTAQSDFDKAQEQRLRAADREAIDYVTRTTGMPSKDWIGWDPRLTMDDVKLRTLTLGKADMFKYGFWQSDEDRNKRIVALDGDHEVTTDYDRIRKSMSGEREHKQRMEDILFRHGFAVSNITLSKASQSELRVQSMGNKDKDKKK
jgi:hypothetical protein